MPLAVEAVQDYHTHEVRNLFPDDLKLRVNGFTVHSRPKYGPALWKLGNRVYTQAEALALCEHERPVPEKRLKGGT